MRIVVHTLAAAAALADTPAVLFVGDSYPGGALGIDRTQTFPQQTCQTLGLTCNLDAEGATGYQADGHLLAKSNQPYGKRLADDARLYDAGLVIVSGGRSNVGAQGDEYAAVQPNPAGQRQLATRLVSALRGSGVLAGVFGQREPV